MPERSVLISGASIAGPALAYWLRRHGWRPVLIERADALRTGGQNVDVRGAGREVARRMGIEDDIRAANTGELGLRFVDAHDVTRAAFPAGKSDTAGFTAELEILRGSLAEILHARTRDTCEYVFGDHITGLHDHGDRVTASFAKGEPRDFDLVIAAEGIGSPTRGLVFGDEPQIRRLGLYSAYLAIPRGPTDSAWARWFNAPGGRSMLVRPDNFGTTRVMLSFLSRPGGPEHHEKLAPAARNALLREVFADVGWEAPRILAALDDADDLYFEHIGQVRTPHWSRGRVGLVGDAAWCASPISGMGTSLALVGAYVLAGELARHTDHTAGFAAYEQRMRPYVDQAQKLPPGTPRLAHPRTRVGIAVFNAALAVGAALQRTHLLDRLFSPPADAIDLPDYVASN